AESAVQVGRGTRNDEPVDERVRRGSDHARTRHRGHADHELYRDALPAGAGLSRRPRVRRSRAAQFLLPHPAGGSRARSGDRGGDPARRCVGLAPASDRRSALVDLLQLRGVGHDPGWRRGLMEPVITSSLGVALLPWGPLALEFAIALGLVLDQRARSRLLVLGIGFHAGIAVMIGLVSFAIAMWAALILFLRPMRQEFNVRGLAPLRIFRLWFRESARRAPLPRIVGE